MRRPNPILSLTLFVDLSTRFLANGSLEVVAPADIIDSCAKCESVALEGNALRSEDLNMGSGDATVLAVSRARKVRLVQFALTFRVHKPARVADLTTDSGADRLS